MEAVPVTDSDGVVLSMVSHWQTQSHSLWHCQEWPCLLSMTIHCENQKEVSQFIRPWRVMRNGKFGVYKATCKYWLCWTMVINISSILTLYNDHLGCLLGLLFFFKYDLIQSSVYETVLELLILRSWLPKCRNYVPAWFSRLFLHLDISYILAYL